MEILQVKDSNSDFVLLCKELEEYQFKMLPILRDKNYSLTDNLDDIIGFVLYTDNVPIGSIGLKHISDDVCEIVRVFVREDYRGNGYATMLFEKIEDLARQKGYSRAEMVAWAKATPALRLYDNLKYQMTDEKNSEWYDGEKYIELHKFL